MFKKGTMVTCIDNSKNSRLVVGKRYKVLRCFGTRLMLAEPFGSFDISKFKNSIIETKLGRILYK